MLIWGAVLVSLVDNVVRPMLVSGRANVGTLTVFIGVLGGLAAFGAIGLFLGPVVLALIIALIRFMLEIRRAEKAAAASAEYRRSDVAVDELSSDHTLRIATRQSRLALWQAEHVAALLRARASGT